MPVTPVIITLGVRKLNADIRKMSGQAPVEVRTVVKDALEPMRRTAISQSPGSHRTIGGRWLASMRGANGALTNRHPGARVNEFGGHITPNPRRQPRGITFEPSHMIYGPGGAIEESKQDTERGLLAGFERLARANGW